MPPGGYTKYFILSESPNVFFFPVICNNKIVSLYTVGLDFEATREKGSNQFICSISTSGVDTIEKICKAAAPGVPILVFREEHYHTMARAGEKVFLLWRCPGILEEPSYVPIDVPEKTMFPVSITYTILAMSLPQEMEYSTIISAAGINLP